MPKEVRFYDLFRKIKLTLPRFREQHLAASRHLHCATFHKRRCLHWLDSEMALDSIGAILLRCIEHGFPCTFDGPFIGFP